MKAPDPEQSPTFPITQLMQGTTKALVSDILGVAFHVGPAEANVEVSGEVSDKWFYKSQGMPESIQSERQEGVGKAGSANRVFLHHVF